MFSQPTTSSLSISRQKYSDMVMLLECEITEIDSSKVFGAAKRNFKKLTPTSTFEVPMQYRLKL